MSIKKKPDDAKSMVQYTYRDMGQEFIMKKKMIRAIIIAIIAIIALLVFIALYVDEKRRVQETFVARYKSCLQTVSEDIQFYLNMEGDGDLTFKYNHITADMNSVYSFSFLIDDFEEQQKSMNALYSAFLRYPQQMKEKLPEAKQAIDDIIANLDKGYDEVDAIVDSLNLKGY